MRKSYLLYLFIIMTVACRQQGSESFIPANNSNISYSGRFDFSHKSKPVFMYSGCAIRTVFNGTSVALIMKDDSLRNLFTVKIDDSIFVLKTNNRDNKYLLAKNLQDKNHSLEISRRTEWHAGNTVFEGFCLDRGQRLSKPEPRRHVIEFIGDSYTCGYGNEGKSREEHFTYETENNYLTYGAITARALDADYYGICRSGIGIWQGYGGNTDFTMPKFYDEVIMNSSKKWDFERIKPQLVSIDLGANDLSATLDSAKFVSTYKLFLERIRKNYPSAKIICIAGPSAPGAEWEKWKSLLHATINETGKNTKDLYYFEFGTFEPNGSDYHPNIPEHMKMADELIPYFKNLMNW